MLPASFSLDVLIASPTLGSSVTAQARPMPTRILAAPGRVAARLGRSHDRAARIGREALAGVRDELSLLDRSQQRRHTNLEVLEPGRELRLCARVAAALNSYWIATRGGVHSTLTFASAFALAWHSALAIGGSMSPSQRPLHAAMTSAFALHDAARGPRTWHCPAWSCTSPGTCPALESASAATLQLPMQTPSHCPSTRGTLVGVRRARAVARTMARAAARCRGLEVDCARTRARAAALDRRCGRRALRAPRTRRS